MDQRRYLLIHEDGALETATELTKVMVEMVDSGYLSIVDMVSKQEVDFHGKLRAIQATDMKVWGGE